MKICTVFIALSIAVSALAQSPNAPYLTIKEESAFFLALPVVQKELKATPEQIAKWSKVFQKSTEDQQAVYANTKLDASDDVLAANEQAVQKLDKEAAEAAIAVATEAQIKRVRQIALQRLNIEAFAKTDVQADLGLTADQKKSIGDLVEDYQKKLDDFSEELAKQLESAPEATAGDAASQKAYQDKINAAILASKPKAAELQILRKDTESKVLASLTQTQRTKWKTMLGMPFDLSEKAPS